MRAARVSLVIGFTMIEVLAVLAVLAVIGTMGYVAVSNTTTSAASAKLDSDVASINRSIQIYLSNGGSLEGVTTIDALLAKLKTRGDSTKTLGVTSSVLDARIVADYGDSSQQLRACWLPSPDNRLVVKEGTSGAVKFKLDESLAANAATVESGRTATKQLAANSSWVWDYQNTSPAAPTPGGIPATTATAGGALGNATITQLSAPTFSPGGGTSALASFSKNVTITNPNGAGTSQIYYSSGGGAYTLYTGPVPMGPGILSAVAVSLDPARYVTSPTQSATYLAQINLAWNTTASAVTYQQVTTGNYSASVAADGSGPFTIRYTTDGTTPTVASAAYTSALTLAANMWTSSSLCLKAIAITSDAYYVASPEADATVSVTKTNLNAPIITPGSEMLPGSSVTVSITKATADPTGTILQYTTDGTDPGSGSTPTSGTLYSGNFTSGAGTITVRSYAPAGTSLWFTTSPSMAAAYTVPSYPDGALVGSVDLNGTFNGSLIYTRPASGIMSDITFNKNAVINGGNLYLPGTPAIKLSNGTVWANNVTVDNQFATHIIGRDFNMDGTENIPATVTPFPRVNDLAQLLTPSNYSVIFNSSSTIQGKVFRQFNSPLLPTVSAPPAPTTGGGTRSFSTAPSGPISAATYSNVTLSSSGAGNVTLTGSSTPRTTAADLGGFGALEADNGTAFVLGDATHPDVTQYYTFSSLSLNSGGSLKIVGKVVVTITGSVSISNASVIGNVNNTSWLTMRFSGTAGFAANSGSKCYADIVAPGGTVAFNAGSTFTGSAVAKTLGIYSNSVVFSDAPVISN